MTALVVLIFVLIWMIIIHLISYVIVKYLVPKGRRLISYFALLIFFTVGSFADELIDQQQIKEMCNPENLLIYNPENVQGKTVIFREVPNERISSPVDANIVSFHYVEINSGELLVEYKKINIKGGWLSKLIGFDHAAPITYRGKCGPIKPKSYLKQKYAVKFIYK
ncbi:MAG: hypothetical protein V7784_15245 [Oceanospirillaceae bacterium]